MFADAEQCYLAVQSADARFDGVFYTAVTSTRIYCRPSCSARTPRAENCRFFPSAAAAQLAGFRACKRCRPDTVPGAPEWQSRSDIAARAVRLIADGLVDRDGVRGLAAAVGYSERQLNRVMHDALGAGPLALARSQRAHNARILIETTTMPFTEITYASGFSSIRQFNDTIREIYVATPTEMRSRRNASVDHRVGTDAVWVPGMLALQLAYRPPIALEQLLAFLGARSLPGIEQLDGMTLTRSLRLPNGNGVVQMRAGRSCADAVHGDSRRRSGSRTERIRSNTLDVSMQLEDVRDLAPAVARVRRWFDLDADPVAIDEVLGRDPLLRAAVRVRPGMRVPGSVDATEMAVRAIVGQQVSVAGARTIVGRIVHRLGEPLSERLAGRALGPVRPATNAGTNTATSSGINARLLRLESEAGPAGGPLTDGSVVTSVFPSAAAIAEGDLTGVGMPTARIATVQRVCAAIAEGIVNLDAGADRAEVREQLLDLRGIGPWTADYLAMRALGDPDAFLPTDLGVRHAAAALGIDDIAAHAQRWRPWRAYGLMHLWATL